MYYGTEKLYIVQNCKSDKAFRVRFGPIFDKNEGLVSVRLQHLPINVIET